MTVGEDAEFTELVERQWRFVFRVAYAVLLNPHDAEDAVQETFLKLYRNRGWRNMENERAFLARVAWRIAVNRSSSSARAYVAETGESSAKIADSQSSDPGPEEMLILADDHARIHSMIDSLPEELRLPWYFLQTMSSTRVRLAGFSACLRGPFVRDCSGHANFYARRSLCSANLRLDRSS